MNKKVMLFCHNDLDGIGCAVLAILAFGEENVDIEYCGYNDINEKVAAFIRNEEKLTGYSQCFITDISVNKEVAELINETLFKSLWSTIKPGLLLLDHHATALWLNEYFWADVVVCDENGVKTSGTELFYNYLKEYDLIHSIYCESITEFVEIVRDYDTWRWKEAEDSRGEICKKINDLLYIYGRDEFIRWCLKKLMVSVSPLIKFSHLNSQDELVLEIKQREIDSYIEKKGSEIRILQDIYGRKFGLVFADRYFSELGNVLSERHPELWWICMIDVGAGKVSLRTIRDDVDLGQEIKHSGLNGGGHAKAAGYVLGKEFGNAIASMFGLVWIRCGWSC